MTWLRRWFVNPWVQWSICVLLGTIAEIFLKIGAVQTADPANPWSWTGLTGWLDLGLVGNSRFGAEPFQLARHLAQASP